MATKRVDHKGKGSREEILPSRFALTQLTQGDPAQRSLGNYAKATPGINNTQPYQMWAGPARGLKTEAMPFQSLANETGEP